MKGMDALTGSDFHMESYDSQEALRLKESILAVYLASHHDQQHDPWFGPGQFWERLVDLYAPTRDFGLVAAWQGDTMIGYAFGSPRDDAAATWEIVSNALPDVEIPAVPEPIYLFREFAVDPSSQGRGYGRMIHNVLLQDRPERLAHLVVRQDNPAKDIYKHWGWRIIGQVQPFSDSPVMDSMVRVLPLADMN